LLEAPDPLELERELELELDLDPDPDRWLSELELERDLLPRCFFLCRKDVEPEDAPEPSLSAAFSGLLLLEFVPRRPSLLSLEL